MTRQEMLDLDAGGKVEISEVYDNSPTRGPVRVATVQNTVDDANNPFALHTMSVVYDDDATLRWHRVMARDVVRVISVPATI